MAALDGSGKRMKMIGLVVLASFAVVPAVAASPQQRAGVIVPARIDPQVVQRIYNDAIIREGGIDNVVKQLASQCGDAARAKRARANACLLRSHLEWRHGRMTPALAAAEEGLAIDPYDALVYHKAQLLDATGRMEETRIWYQKALDLTTSAELKENIRLRLTFADAISQNVKGLVELAKTRPSDFRNRAAIALAILDYGKDAAELYQVFGEGSERFRQHVRVAQWAIQAKAAPKAQEESWKAVRSATLDADRNYALSLLVEAHTIDKSLDKLLEKLAQHPNLTTQEQAVRVDLLRQTGRYRDAIALFTSAHGKDLAPDARRELLRMYRDAGEDEAMVAEYRRLIAAEPALTDWAEGLSQYYLEKGDTVGARKVWDDFLARNNDVNTLLFGSDSMTSFGLHDLALTATDKALAQKPTTEDAARIHIARFELYRRRGMNTEAEGSLASLDKLLTPDAAFRIELADAYERIQKPQLAARTLEALGVARGGLSVDERMRLAWLLDSTGRRDDALEVWKGLWTSESLAARRKLVEERLLMLAAELGTLGDLAVDLETKLANRTAVPRDVSLLVSIYTKVGDSVSAIETVTGAAKQGGRNSKTEVELLKEQAQIYLALAEYPEFERVTRRLIDVDPENKVDYLQSLLLNKIEGGAGDSDPEAATAQLRGWLTQLREVGGDAVGAEFEAGVLELAGYRDQALESYRRALALHPERADDHLLLADLLRQAGRQAEAITSLQYIIEVADTDELFLIAIDGITNMRTANPATMKWAQRRALERLTSRDDKIYLYEMLGELAEETKDAKGYIAALDASLAHADSRRSHVLRELLSATAEVTTYEASLRSALPNAELNLAYGRRLIALGEELPPDVYMDLGRTFIKMNDPAAARRAFDLAVDKTGRTSIVLEAAKMFERGGFDKESTREYERALVSDIDNLETMSRLANARARAGNLELANELYLRALTSVVSRQNRSVERGQEKKPPALEGLVSFDYKKYYQSLLSGFLSTLPASQQARAARIAPFEEAFAAELKQLSSPLLPIAYYPRLNVLANTLRASAYAAGLPEPAHRADEALRQQFAEDTVVAIQAAEERKRWGYAPVTAAGTGPASPGTAAVEAPAEKNSSDYVREVGLALSAGDQDAALAVYRQWARYAGSPKPSYFIGTIELPDRSPGIPEVASHAFQRLDERRFTSLAQHILGLITDNDTFAEKIMLDLVYQYETPEVPILTRIERTLKQPLITEERLMRLVNKRPDWSLLNLNYVLGNVSADRQIDLIERYTKASEFTWFTWIKAIGVVMQKPLTEAQAERFMAMAKGALINISKKASGTSILPNFMNYAITTGIHPSNERHILEIEQFIAERHPSVFKVGYFKATMLKDLGRDLEAVKAFVDAAVQMYVPMPTPGTVIQQGTPTPYAYQQYVRNFAPFLFPKYKSELMAALEAKEKGPDGLNDALISLRIELANADPTGDARQLMASLQAMADRNPKNEQVRSLLHPMYDQWGYTDKAIEVLTQLTQLKPDNRDYRYRLVTLWQRLDYPENVVKAAGSNTVAELAPVVPRNYYMESVTGPPAVRFPTLKKAVDQIKALSSGGKPEDAALGLRTLLQTLPPGGMGINEFAQTRDPSDPYLYMRDFLMLDGENPPKPAESSGGAAAAGSAGGGATPVAVAPAGGTVVAVGGGGMVAITAARPAGAAGAPAGAVNTYDRLLKSLELEVVEQTPRPAKLVDVIGRSGFAIGELESYLTNLRAADIDSQYVFVNMLVDALGNSGRADAELARRASLLASGQAGEKDVTIWLGLAAKQPRARAIELVQTAEQGGFPARAKSGLSRIYLARLYAAAGQEDKALKSYQSVANTVLAGTANTLQPNTLQTDPYGRDNGLMLFTGIGLFDEVRARVSPASLDAFVAEMISLSRPPESPTIAQNFSRFVSILYVRGLREGLVLPSLQKEAAALKVTAGWSRAEQLQAAFVRAHIGKTDEALAMLQNTMRKDLETRVIMSVAESNAMFAARQYQIALGLIGDPTMVGPFGTTGQGIEELKPMFPVKADQWPGAKAWVAAVAAAVPGWVEKGTANADAAVQVLSLAALRLHQLGDPAAAAEATKRITAILRTGPLSVKASTLAMSVADKVGAPIDLDVLQEMVRTNRLHISRVVPVMTRTAQAQGPEAAIRLGEAAARFTSDDGLIAKLVELAKTSGNAAETERWTTRQREAADARAALKKR
jgi:hypothetical protein